MNVSCLILRVHREAIEQNKITELWLKYNLYVLLVVVGTRYQGEIIGFNAMPVVCGSIQRQVNKNGVSLKIQKEAHRLIHYIWWQKSWQKKEFSYYSSTRHPQRCKSLWLLRLQRWFISKHSSPTHHPKALYLIENVDNTRAIHSSPTCHIFRVTSELSM